MNFDNNMIWTIIIILGVVALAAWIMEHIQVELEYGKVEPEAKEEARILIPLDLSKLCDDHSWEEAVFLYSEDYEDAVANPGKYPKTRFCTKCGYVPEYQKLVEPGYLNMLRAQLNYAAAMRARVIMINQLKNEFQLNYLHNQVGLTAGEIVRIKQGWDLYDSFLDALPGLVEEYELMSQLESDIRHIDTTSKFC